MESAEQFERLSGLRPAEGLREFYVSAEVSEKWLAELRQSSSADPWTHGFGVRDVVSDQIIGTAGFKGAPDDQGVVEIGYGIVPSFQGQGLAREAASALIVFAAQHPRVQTIRAHTAPEHNASTKVLLHCGFAHLGEVLDPEDGRVWRWERPAR